MQHPSNVINLHVYSASKSSGRTSPRVASRILNDAAKLGILVPATQRDTVGCSTPIRSANSRCESLSYSRKSASRIPNAYHQDMQKQVVDAVRIAIDNGTIILYLAGMVNDPTANPIRRLREASGLNQPALAERIGSQQAQLSRWEMEPGNKNYRRVPLKWAKLIARELDVPVSVIRPPVVEYQGDSLPPHQPPAPAPVPVVDQALELVIDLVKNQTLEIKAEVVIAIMAALRDAAKKSAA